jgi:PAS domain S-box-containing protein
VKVETPFSLTGEEAMSVLERLPQAVLVADDQRTYVYANDALCQILGQPLHGIIGHRLDEFVPAANRDHIPEQWSAFLAAGRQHGKVEFLRPDGERRYVEFTGMARIQPARHIFFVRDVTDEKNAREAQIASERIAQLALQAQRMGHWYFDLRTGEFRSDPMLAAIFDLPEPQAPLHWQAFVEALHPDDKPYVTQKLGSVLQYGNDYSLEYRVVRQSGDARWVSDRGRAVFDTDGTRIGILGVCWDTTEQRRWEASLRFSENRFRSLVEQSPFSTQIFHPDGSSVMVNKAWSEFWGAQPHEIPQGYNVLQDKQLISRGVMPLVERAFRGESIELPVIAYEPGAGKYTGDTIWIRTFIYPVCDDDNHVREVVFIHEDVSDNKRLEQDRAKQAEELIRSNAELQRFVYVASHDLKEPLRSMMAFSQLLSERSRLKLNADEVDCLDHISDGAKRMSALIDGLLDYSRASFVRDLVVVPADLNDLLQQATENLRMAVSQTRAVITANALPVAKCAPLNIVQLFQNLIGNSIKYSGTKEPRIHVSAEDEGHFWRVAVQDNGIGIDASHHDQIFGVFTRLHGREYAGTGIGLAICKAIVEKHQGQIGVESEKGAGAKFFFTLPK